MIAVAGVLVIGALVAAASAVRTQEQSVRPATYNGTVTFNGQPLPDNLRLIARIDDYETVSVVTNNGRYQGLVVQPPKQRYVGQEVTFFVEGTQAYETDTFVPGRSGPNFTRYEFDLSFPSLPMRPPTPTPTATNTPTPTNTPVVARPSVYSGTIIVSGGSVWPGARLEARLGDHRFPALVEGQQYSNLVIAPGDLALVGELIEFYLDGVKSDTTDTYENGARKTEFDLIFVGASTPRPRPTIAPISRTVAAPTSEDGEGDEGADRGGCFAIDGGGSPLSGAANALLMLAPIGLIAGYRRTRRPG